jgi:hypothetical protein
MFSRTTTTVGSAWAKKEPRSAKRRRRLEEKTGRELRRQKKI